MSYLTFTYIKTVGLDNQQSVFRTFIPKARCLFQKHLSSYWGHRETLDSP